MLFMVNQTRKHCAVSNSKLFQKMKYAYCAIVEN